MLSIFVDVLRIYAIHSNNAFIRHFDPSRIDLLIIHFFSFLNPRQHLAQKLQKFMLTLLEVRLLDFMQKGRKGFEKSNTVHQWLKEMKLRVAAVQLNSILGNVEENIAKATRMLEQAFNSAATKPDLIVLPELALTGYNFKSPEHIKPFLEHVGSGKSYEFGKTVSQRWNCMTLLGYPEKYGKGDYKIYNSAVLIDQSGKVLQNYRKTHLYDTDKTWGCSESPDGFKAFDLLIRGKHIRTTIGICMDLNPYEFKAPFENYEFASHASQEKCQLILVPTAWMNSNWDENWTSHQLASFKKIFETQSPIVEINTEHDRMKDNAILYMKKETKLAEDFKLDKPDGSTGRYWVIRLDPLFSSEHPGLKQCVIVCNRSGMEDKLMYGGTSSMFTFYGGAMRKSEEGVSIDFSIEGSLGQGTEGVLVRELEI